MRLSHLLVISTALVATLLAGCSQNFKAQFAIRPDLPPYDLAKKPCENLKDLYDSSAALEQAYRTRATWNRDAVWVAGVLALATIAATGGLGAAGAASLSIALVSVSGAFVSGSFALFHNDTLATAYKDAANQVASALKVVNRDYKDPGDSAKCSTEMTTLSADVTKAANDLETARTDVALAAKNGIADQVAAVKTAVVDAMRTAVVPTQTAAPTQTVAPTPH
jgi:hypothetical protein